MAIDDYSYTGVLSSEESKQKNYLVVNRSPKGDFVCSKLAICLIATFLILLLLGAIAGTYFLTTFLTHNDKYELSETESSYAMPQSYSRRAKKLNVYDRLPTNVVPIFYKVRLTPFLEGNFTTDGHVTIKIECMVDSKNITLNVKDILIDEKSVTVCQYDFKQTECNNVEIRGHLYDELTETYVIQMKETMIIGRKYTINIHFISHLNDYLQGFYRSHYIDSKSRETRWLASTLFSPTYARRAFPCFDEPNRKARFTISIARNAKKYHTLSNMPIKNSQPLTDMEGWVWDHFEETPMMSTYLLGFIVSDLRPLNDSNFSGKRSAGSNPPRFQFSVWSRPEAINQTYYAYRIGPKVLTYFEHYFGVNYPLPKIDMVAVPDFGYNAMENWGLITFRETAMLYDEKRTTAKAKQSIALTLSHELVHQWFGNLVTPNWWNDLWLKEGFATFFEYLGANYVEPNWNLLDQFVLDEVFPTYTLDALDSSHPISDAVNHGTEIRQIFNPISYDKGAAIIRMMFHFLGEIDFRKGMTAYLRKNSYGNTDRNDLWDALNKEISTSKLPENLTVQNIMDGWTRKAGFPLVTITRNYENGVVEIRQKKFTFHNDSKTRPKRDASLLWDIPISYTTEEEYNFNKTIPKLWLTRESTSLNSIPVNKNQWVFFNLQNVGFYRVNYDPTNWKMLTNNYLKLPEIARAQLINDAMSNAQAAELDYEVALDVLKELSKEVNYVPWKAGSDVILYLRDMLAFTPIYGEFRSFILGIVRRTYEEVDFQEKLEDSHLRLMHREQILRLVCLLDDPSCLRLSQIKFRDLIVNANSDNAVSPNLKRIVYCASIQKGGKEEWEFMYQQYLDSNVASDKELMLAALGCASEHWILARYLNFSISGNPEIRKQDGSLIFMSVANNIVGSELAFNFLQNNWEQINEYYGEGFNTVSKMVESVGRYLNTQTQLQELINFKQRNINNLYSTERGFDKVIERVGLNVKWLERNYQTIESWLRKINQLYGL